MIMMDVFLICIALVAEVSDEDDAFGPKTFSRFSTQQAVGKTKSNCSI